MSGTTQGDAWHPALALRFQTPKSETSSTSFILGPDDGSIRHILNVGKKEGNRTDWQSKAADIKIKYEIITSAAQCLSALEARSKNNPMNHVIFILFFPWS